MALTRTTLAAAITASATSFTVTSATGFAATDFLRVNDEWLYVQEVTGTTIKAQRGRLGTLARPHGILSVAVVGSPVDFLPEIKPQMYSYGAAGAITPKPGLHRLVAGSAAAMTLVAPTADQEGQEMTIVATAAQAYVLTLGAGYFNAATNTKATFGAAIGDVLKLIAINQSWYVTLNKNITLAAS